MNKYNFYFLPGITDLESDYDVSKEGIELSNLKFEISCLDEEGKRLEKANFRMYMEMPCLISNRWAPSLRDGKYSLDGMVVVKDQKNTILDKNVFENAKCKVEVNINEGKATTKLTITADRFIWDNSVVHQVFES